MPNSHGTCPGDTLYPALGYPDGQWLYYLVDKLMTRKGIRSKDLAAFHHRILSYASAEELMLKDVYFNGVLTLNMHKG